VFHWSPGTLGRVRKVLAQILQDSEEDLWVCDDISRPHLPRYLALLGFHPAEFIIHDGAIKTAFRKRFI